MVDLRDPRCAGKASDERFLHRVFADAEIRDIRAAPDPDRALWIRWAAKEAAFKTVSKVVGSPPPFEHASFRVSLRPGGEAWRRGTVRYGEREVPFTLDEDSDRLHVTAWAPGVPARRPRLHREVHLDDELPEASRPGWRNRLIDRFSDREWDAIHGVASALVRLRARASLARVLRVEESALEIVCDEGPPGRSLPRVLAGGEPARTDVSLSHHHRLLAWAFTLPEADGDDLDPGPEESDR